MTLRQQNAALTQKILDLELAALVRESINEPEPTVKDLRTSLGRINNIDGERFAIQNETGRSYQGKKFYFVRIKLTENEANIFGRAAGSMTFESTIEKFVGNYNIVTTSRPPRTTGTNPEKAFLLKDGTVAPIIKHNIYPS